MHTILLSLLLAVAVPQVPEPAHQVSDQAHILAGPERQALDDELAALSHDLDAVVQVVTMAKTEGEAPQQLALRTLRAWALPERSVLILVAMDQRQVWIQPGPALEAVFSRATATRLYEEAMAPDMRAGRYAEGLRKGAQRLRVELAPKPAPPVKVEPLPFVPRVATLPFIAPAPEPMDGSKIMATVLGVVVVLLIVALVICAFWLAWMLFSGEARREWQSHDDEQDWLNRDPPVAAQERESVLQKACDAYAEANKALSGAPNPDETTDTPEGQRLIKAVESMPCPTPSEVRAGRDVDAVRFVASMASQHPAASAVVDTNGRFSTPRRRADPTPNQPYFGNPMVPVVTRLPDTSHHSAPAPSFDPGPSSSSYDSGGGGSFDGGGGGS